MEYVTTSPSWRHQTYSISSSAFLNPANVATFPSNNLQQFPHAPKATSLFEPKPTLPSSSLRLYWCIATNRSASKNNWNFPMLSSIVSGETTKFAEGVSLNGGKGNHRKHRNHCRHAPYGKTRPKHLQGRVVNCLSKHVRYNNLRRTWQKRLRSKAVIKKEARPKSKFQTEERPKSAIQKEAGTKSTIEKKARPMLKIENGMRPKFKCQS